ncbi:MAG: SDR family oxidoreductase [Acidimicrobiales bacterium]
MGTIFVTGYPGFLAGMLLPRLLDASPEQRAVCLVQPRWAQLARSRLSGMGEDASRVELVEGDITEPGLGLASGVAARLAAEVTQVYHLAAVYDLSVSREMGMAVNEGGTRNVVGFAGGCEGLERLHYVSTCYVSGRWAGIFREPDLVLGQRFNNFYEETKYLAEVVVHQAMAGGMPATVYRPSIVVGDSATGETQKYDGPYYALQLISRQAKVAVVPVAGDPSAFRFNLVPRDFVISAIVALSRAPEAVGRVFALADPRPLTVLEVLRLFADLTGKRLVTIPVTRRLAKASLERLRPVQALMRVPASSIDYLNHPTHYDTSQATPLLESLGVQCPPFTSYAGRLVDYAARHPEVGSQAMT